MKIYYLSYERSKFIYQRICYGTFQSCDIFLLFSHVDFLKQNYLYNTNISCSLKFLEFSVA